VTVVVIAAATVVGCNQRQANQGSPVAADALSTPSLAAVLATPTPRPTATASSPPRSTPVPPRIPETLVLTGTWASPEDDAIVTNALILGAVPVQERPNVPVTEVTFTMEWLGYSGPACYASKPATGSVWSCLAHPASWGAPPGPLKLGFDVTDELGAVVHLPDGIRTVTLAPFVAPAGWTTPQLVDSTPCYELVATIDATGGYHVAAECDGSIQYSASRSGGEWQSRTFPHPSRRRELNPQIATEGDRMYVAYTRVAVVDGGCGDPGLRDVGVYYRQRSLPDGRWSAPIRLGLTDDHLQSFRVVDEVIHATVRADAEHVYYETLDGATFNRYQLAGVMGGTSLRIGSDGRARIAYEAGGELELAEFDGSEFSTTPIPGSGGGYAPNLVLGANNDAHIVWTRAYHGLGCAEPGPFPEDGTYYATNVGGSWVTERITPDVGQASITMDAATSRVHVLLSGGGGLLYYTRTTNDAWDVTGLSDAYRASPIIRLDPTTGTLLVVFYGSVGPRTEGIYAMAKP
jgi:hypothetical protein